MDASHGLKRWSRYWRGLNTTFEGRIKGWNQGQTLPTDDCVTMAVSCQQLGRA